VKGDLKAAHKQALQMKYSGISIYRFSGEWRKQAMNMGKRLIRKTTFFNQKSRTCLLQEEPRIGTQDGRQRNSHPRLKYLSVQEFIRAQD
jgi:hypothetical protein